MKSVPLRPECPLCGSRRINALNPWEEEEIKIAKKKEKDKSEEERKRMVRVFKNVNLVLLHGKTAAIALASRGMGMRLLRELSGS